MRRFEAFSEKVIGTGSPDYASGGAGGCGLARSRVREMMEDMARTIRAREFRERQEAARRGEPEVVPPSLPELAHDIEGLSAWVARRLLHDGEISRQAVHDVTGACNRNIGDAVARVKESGLAVTKECRKTEKGLWQTWYIRVDAGHAAA
jgi:hypothetical protein